MAWISVLGDSLSTYEGWQPPDYAVFYAGLNLARAKMSSVNDIWWMRLIRKLGGDFCANSAYSGSRVSGGEFPAACCQERISALRRSSIDPELILVYIGFNDFGYGVPLKRKHFWKKDYSSFEDSYMLMLNRLKTTYPDSTVLCGTLIKGIYEDCVCPEYLGGTALSEYNRIIRECVRTAECGLADLASLNIIYETLDGAHATAAGHAQIADAWYQCLSSYLGF